MKEWLLKTEDGKYHYYRDDMDCCPKHVEKIEIPEGADKYIQLSFKNNAFYKDNFKMAWNGKGWIHTEWCDENLKIWLKCKVLWQRQEVFVDESGIVNGECSIKGNLSVEGTLAERQKTYGCFEDVATVTEEIIKALKIGNYDNMPKPHKMAMYMIASKMARLVNGDHNHLDSWHDIGGYAKLIEKLIGGENE